MPATIDMRYGCNPHQAAARCFMADGRALPIEPLNDAPSYINLMDALNAWQLVRDLKRALGRPAAASFKHVSPAGAAVAAPLDEALSASYFVANRALSPLATAYARARGADRLASFGDWIALSDVVDVPTAELIRAEVSDGIIAPGYEREALAILKKKKGGQYRILQIDPDYAPKATEQRQIFGVQLAQQRNDFIPDDAFFRPIVTARKKLAGECASRPNGGDHRPQVHPIQLGVSSSRRPSHRHRRRPAVAHPLRALGLRQGRQLVSAPTPQSVGHEIRQGPQAPGKNQRHRHLSARRRHPSRTPGLGSQFPCGSRTAQRRRETGVAGPPPRRSAEFRRLFSPSATTSTGRSVQALSTWSKLVGQRGTIG